MTYQRSASLSPRALKAINYYMRGYDKTSSMRMAGYSETSINSHLQTFWKSKSVKAELKERMRKVAVKADITVEKVIAYLEELKNVNPTDLVDSEGNLKIPSDIAPDVARLLNWRMVRGKVSYESIDKLKITELQTKLSGLLHENIHIKSDDDFKARLFQARKQANLDKEESGPLVEGYE